MKKLIAVFLMLGGFLSTAVAQDEPRELTQARTAYQSQLKFAAQTYLQKHENIRKAQAQDQDSKELKQLRTSYLDQLKFAAQSYLRKLESMRKLPSLSKSQVYAVRDEIANFKAPEAVPQPDDVPEKTVAETADNKEVKPAEPTKEVASEDEEDDAEDDNPEVKPAVGVIPSKTTTVVAATTLEDGKLRLHEDIRNLSIEDLTADWLKEQHQYASARPRPENYDFTEDAFKSYVASIPEDKRLCEEKRFRQVSGIKNYVVRLMERNTYDKPVELKDSSTLSKGIMVNPNYISVKSGRKKFKRVGWDQLPVGQMANILESFAELRLKASGGATVSKEQQQRDAAEDYLRIGIFCDWYEDYESAVKFAKKAVETEPALADSVKKYMMQ